MKARDVMTADIAVARPETPVAEIARLLLARHISAVPVVDESGAPVGMVSEGDLIGARDPRGEWWLALLAGDATEVAVPAVGTRLARDVMSSPVVTVDETTELAEIATLLAQYRIKRVPVLRNGRIVGIVSRADLLRGLVAPLPAAEPRPGLMARVMAEIDGGFRHHHDVGPEPKPVSATEIAAAKFQAMARSFKQKRVLEEEARHAAEMAEHNRRAVELSRQHLSDEAWQDLLRRAEAAAGRGETEFLLLRFPCQLCSDGGRAVNAAEPSWPATLRGEAAELYLRWDREARPHGFELTARVLDFPDGMPGDIGLFLLWAQPEG